MYTSLSFYTNISGLDELALQGFIFSKNYLSMETAKK